MAEKRLGKSLNPFADAQANLVSSCPVCSSRKPSYYASRPDPPRPDSSPLSALLRTRLPSSSYSRPSGALGKAAGNIIQERTAAGATQQWHSAERLHQSYTKGPGRASDPRHCAACSDIYPRASARRYSFSAAALSNSRCARATFVECKGQTEG